MRPMSKVDEPYRVNDKITASTVRVVCEGMESRVCTVYEALEIAKSINLDLVEISKDANPPVCKVLNYSKFKYQWQKKQNEIKSNNQRSGVVKEIQLGPNIGNHDFEFKLRHAMNFLTEKFTVKMCVRFTGRTMCLKDHGEVLLNRFKEALSDYGTVDKQPKMEGRKMYMVLFPKR